MSYQLKTSVLAFSLFLIFTGSAHGGEVLKLGKIIYKKRCRVCHGDKGNGNTFINNAVKVPPADFTDPGRINGLTYRRMKHSISYGRSGTAMVSWRKELSEKEIESVIAFIRTSIMKIEKKAHKPSVASKDTLPDIFFSSEHGSQERYISGKKVYEKHCYHCHGKKGDANMPVQEALLSPPRNFTDPTIVDTLSVEQMYYSIRDGIDGSAMVSWKRELTKEKILDIIHYIRKEFMKKSQ